MGITYSELQRRVFLGFPRTDGEAFLAVKQAINDALTALVSTGKFDALLERDLTNAETVDGQRTYHLVDDLGLTLPKDIDSIILHADSNSRKLAYVAPRELDLKIPYPERFGEGKSQWYTRYGENIELIRIPNDAYSLYIRYSKWPTALTDDSDESPLSAQWDHVLVFLSKDIANAYLNEEYVNFTEKAMSYLKLGLAESRTRPDETLVAQPFETDAEYRGVGESWKDPFVKRDY